MKFIKCKCEMCGGSIEFPKYGRGTVIECPHCVQQIMLPQRRPFGLNRNRIVGIILVYGLLCGFVFIGDQYQKYQAARAIDKQREAEWLKRLDDMGKSDPLPPMPIRQLPPQFSISKPDPILSEIQRANDLAESQSEKSDELLDEVRRGNDIAERDARDRRLSESWPTQAKPIQVEIYPKYTPSPKPEGWVLRYNSFSGKWQYAPPDATLKYNSMENRWEFVPSN